MTKQDLTTARKLLEPFTDRTESTGADTEGGYALTAYWRTGGQKLFYTLRDVHEHVDEIVARR